MVRLAESRDHLAFDESAAMGALGSESLLVVARAIVVAVFAEEAALREGRLTDAALEAADVEVLVLHPEHFSRALLLTALTVRLPCKDKRKRDGAAIDSTNLSWTSWTYKQ